MLYYTNDFTVVNTCPFLPLQTFGKKSVNRRGQYAVCRRIILGGTDDPHSVHTPDIQSKGLIFAHIGKIDAFKLQLIVHIDQDLGRGVVFTLIIEGDQAGQITEIFIQLIDAVMGPLIGLLTGHAEPDGIRQLARAGVRMSL